MSIWHLCRDNGSESEMWVKNWSAAGRKLPDLLLLVCYSADGVIQRGSVRVN
jgi:hypothetical protein